MGTLLVMAVACMAVGEGVPNVFTQPAEIQIGFLALGLVLAGILAAWRWELLGGIISLAGWGTFVLAVVGSPRRLSLFFVLLAMPGLLFVGSGLLRRLRT